MSVPFQPQLDPVFITEEQCFHDNVHGRCWLGFSRINLASHNSPAVVQGLECPDGLASGLQFVCGWCAGLPVSCVKVTPRLHIHPSLGSLGPVYCGTKQVAHPWILQSRVPVSHCCLGSEILWWGSEMPFPVLLLTCQLPSSGRKW